MRPEHDARAIEQQVARIAEILAWPEARLYALVESVSRWSPAQQVQHVLLGLIRFADAIQALEEGTHQDMVPKPAPRLMARALLLTGWIPRGRAKAPASVVPDAIPGRAGLLELQAAAKSRWAELAPRAGALRGLAGALPHPLLGPFGAGHWMRFARVHTAHHLSIVDDIDRHRVIPDPLTEPDSLASTGEAH